MIVKNNYNDYLIQILGLFHKKITFDFYLYIIMITHVCAGNFPRDERSKTFRFENMMIDKMT
jgi:hypothetical protein